MALQDDNDAAFEFGGGEQKGVVPPAACSTPTPAVFLAGFLSAGCGLILSLSLLPQLGSYGDGVVHACVYPTPCPADPDARWLAHACVTRACRLRSGGSVYAPLQVLCVFYCFLE